MTVLDGRGFSKFVAAGTYFLRKYRGVLDDLNVFPVPDGDTGSNMYLTIKAALDEARKVEDRPIWEVAEAAAHGALLGARGNSGVILSQMLRGFAARLRGRETIGSRELAAAMTEAVEAARRSLAKPVEGTMLSVAGAAAREAERLAGTGGEEDVMTMAAAIVRAANEALERTPEQLPVLAEAGVVDSGGAGVCYFLEGILRFLPGTQAHATAYPRAAVANARPRRHVEIGPRRFCTELVLENVDGDAERLRAELADLGDSLIVAGSAPTLKIHIHTDDPVAVERTGERFGTIARRKVDDMAEQHRLTLVDPPRKRRSIVAVVPGEGFARIASELGAEVTVPAYGRNPSVAELLVAINATLGREVYLLPNDPNVVLAARTAAEQSSKQVIVVPTRDAPSGIAAQLALAGDDEAPPLEALLAEIAAVRTARVFFADRERTVGGIVVRPGQPAAAIGDRLIVEPTLHEVVLAAVDALREGEDGLVALYYGGTQREEDAERLGEELCRRHPSSAVEWYDGGQHDLQYVISFER